MNDLEDRILDPSCGEGEFLAAHRHAVGIEFDPKHAAEARLRAPAALVHESDFFAWAEETHERFESVVGNPPFIRYQGFTGSMRSSALRQAQRFGAALPELTSSWAPFIAASAMLLKPGGRIAFVVPAEIGHAAYAVPLLEALCARFRQVLVVAVQEKVFPNLSEDAWLLYASGFGERTSSIDLATMDRFEPSVAPPKSTRSISITELSSARGRLRRWLLPQPVLELYKSFEVHPGVARLGALADVNIGYVSGRNQFFHLRPSTARKLRIPKSFLSVAVRRGGSLPHAPVLTEKHVQSWLTADDPVYLLHIHRGMRRLPKAIVAYLNSEAGLEAREAYKCRVRDPWYCVPDVRIPDGFLTYMSGDRVNVVENAARCVGTNSVHVVHMKGQSKFSSLHDAFATALTRLSCEVEGHPLGGGMLKVEPGEAQRVLIPQSTALTDTFAVNETLESGIDVFRRWRGVA